MIIFSLDGVLADCEHRRHLVEIPNCPDYLCCSEGNIYSIKGSKRHRRDTPRKLKHFISNSGYPTVSLYINKIPINYSVHRLICLSFHGECPSGMECLHLDDDKKNNVPLNLKWGSRKENVKIREEIRGDWKGGLKHGRARFTPEQVHEIKRLLSEGIKGVEISKLFNCHTVSISEIKKGHHYRD